MLGLVIIIAMQLSSIYINVGTIFHSFYCTSAESTAAWRSEALAHTYRPLSYCSMLQTSESLCDVGAVRTKEEEKEWESLSLA